MRRVKTRSEGHGLGKGEDIGAFLLHQVLVIGDEEAVLAAADQKDIVLLEETTKDTGLHPVASIDLTHTEDTINAAEARVQKR